MTSPTKLSLTFAGPDGARATDLYRRWILAGSAAGLPTTTISTLQNLAAEALEFSAISGSSSAASRLIADDSRLLALITDSSGEEQSTSVPADPETLESVSSLDEDGLAAVWMQILLSLQTWERFSGAPSQHIILSSVGELIADGVRRELEATDPGIGRSNYVFGAEDRAQRMDAWSTTELSQCPEPHRAILTHAARLALNISTQSSPQLAILDVAVRKSEDGPVLELGALEKPDGGTIRPGQPLTIHNVVLPGFDPKTLLDYAKCIQPDPIFAQEVWVAALRTVAAEGTAADGQAAILATQVNALIPFRNESDDRPRPRGVRTIIQPVESEVSPAEILADLRPKIDSARMHWETLRLVDRLDDEVNAVLHLLARDVFPAALTAYGADACIGAPTCDDGIVSARFNSRALMPFENAATPLSITPKDPATLPLLRTALSEKPERINAAWVGALGVVAEEILDVGTFPPDLVQWVLDSSAELIAIEQVTSHQP